MRILVTGAGGFIGQAVSARLAEAGHEIRGTFRRSAAAGKAVREWARLDLSDPDADVAAACSDMEAVVHLAAHVHVGPVAQLVQRDRFRRVNTAGTEALARAAAHAGVRRFVFLSSIGVNGTETPVVNGLTRPFDERQVPAPLGPYARSKWEAERALERVQAGSPMRIVSLRAPLVFGPGVGANFRALLRWVRLGLPVPARREPASRSMMYVENLAELVARCLTAPEPVTGARVVRDFDYEIAGLVTRIAVAMQRPARLWRLPDRFVNGAVGLPAVGKVLAKLTQPLLIDDRLVRKELDWSPGVDADTSIARTVESFLREPG